MIRLQIKHVLMSLILCLMVMLKCQILEKNSEKIIVCLVNTPIFYVSLVFNSFENFVGNDLVFIIGMFIVFSIIAITFAYVSENIEQI